MHIETSGAGPDLVLIHGWAMHGGIFASLRGLLATHFRVHSVDLPGHGYSVAEVVPDDLAGWTQRVLDAAPARALWVGWSLGGLVTLHAAASAPRRISGIVEIAASPRFVADANCSHGVDASIFAQFDADLQQNYRATIERFLALETLGSVNAQAQLRELKARAFERGEPSIDALHAGLRLLENADLRVELSLLTPPSLWIAGRRDRLVPPAAMRWAAQQSPRGCYVEINSGHAPFLSHADEVAAAIVTFARESSP